MAELMSDFELACVPARADQGRVTIDLPPMRRRP
jgi:hypothetical protein